MKKYLLLFLLSFAVFSCSSDDDEDKINSKIVGKWVCCAYYYEEEDFWGYGFIPDDYYIFKSDGTYETNKYAKKSGTYTFNGSILALDGGFGEVVTFSEDGQQLEWGHWRYKKQ